MHSLHQAVEKDVKNKLEVLFEQWRDDAVGQGVPWMKAGDVIRAMKKTLDTCEREKRGEVKALPDGRNVVAEDGTQGELNLINPRLPPSCCSARATTNVLCFVLPGVSRITDQRVGRFARQVYCPRIPDQRLHHRCVRVAATVHI